MIIYSIYRATNIHNGKCYIGFTKDFKDRIYKHQWKCFNQNINSKFYNAIRKYGWDAFEWNIIFQSKDLDYCLNNMESYFIEQYDSMRNGYNSTTGGESGILSDEVKKTLSEIGKTLYANPNSYYHTQEYKEKMRVSCSGDKNGFYNRTHTQETKELLSTKRQINRYMIIDPENNYYHTTNLKGFCREHNLHSAGFFAVIRGERKSYKGWKIKKETLQSP